MKKLIIKLSIALFGIGVMALAWVWFGWKLALVLFLWKLALALVLFLWEFHTRLETRIK